MENQTIVVRGAREHNLRNVDLELPQNKLIVFTGVSGSGKSSLAFDTLYAEGQRRYVESLSSYARQFMGQMQKPDVDYLSGLSPSISIQQKTAGRNPRSTVGTITEIFDYLRVLYARIGVGHCAKCGRAITAQTREQIIGRVQALPENTRFLVLAPIVRGQKGEYKDLFEDLLKRGFVRARVDGRIVRLTDEINLDRKIKHNIELVIDRLKNEPKVRPRLAEAVEQALVQGEGSLIVAVERDKVEGGEEGTSDYDDILLSSRYACTHCNLSYVPPSPQMFSFNSPQGMCLDCDGLGNCYTFDPELLIPDPSMSFFKGAIPLVGSMSEMGKWRRHLYEGVARTLDIDLKKPWNSLSEEQRDALLNGAGDRHITFEWKHRKGLFKHGGTWEGVIPQLLSTFKKVTSGPKRAQLEKYMRVVRCSRCGGQRLNPQARAVRIGGKTLVEVCAASIGEAAAFFAPDGPLERSLQPIEKTIAEEVLKEIRGRLGFLLNVGLHYLTLDRTAPTLSGGEAQRIRLAGQIGCGLVGVLYILDEPSIGLHPRDNERLLRSLEQLRDVGNTVIVVEHDEDTMRAADHIVDFGPGPGVRGGQVVVSGSYAEVLNHPESLTGQYLSGRKQIVVPEKRRSPNGKALKIIGANHNNLKNLDATIPLGLFVCITGVSGSGKSSLINDILLTGLKQAGVRLQVGNGDEEEDEACEDSPPVRGRYEHIEGIEHLDKVIDIDQSAIGRTPRSNPATYIKLMDEIRSLFAEMTDAQIRGYKPGRFSFNRPGGRCEACEGNGSTRLEMDFLADVWVKCPVCDGKRFNRETLQVRYKGKNIHDILEMDVQEALEHFTNQPRIRAMIQTLHDVGLDYIKLGQPSPTLSGGEAQRIKLAKELCRRNTGKTLYILDEPTTGLHFDDIEKLLRVLHGFVEAGNSVVVIEHNLDVIKTADWIVDLGPEGGSGGGKIVFAGTPEQTAKCKPSFTGQSLAGVLFPEAGKPATPSNGKNTKNGKNGRVRKNGNTVLTHLTVEGAQQHNLKNINVAIPRGAMTVCSGPSGSGKSSLAMDTIYAEGQRRYIESLSAYARQFLGQMQKPKVDRVSGLSPAISIEQKSTSKSPRSTVGTVTEVYDYLRVLFARLGTPYCPKCEIPIGTQTVDEIIARVLSMEEGTKLYVMAPVERHGQEKYQELFEEIRRSGFVRVRVDGTSCNVEEPPDIDHRRKHVVEVVVDRLIVRANQRSRIADAIETALDLGKGLLHIAVVEDRPEPQWRVEKFSQHFACDRCGRSYEPLNPHHFSFNSPLGWCKTCEGLGVQQGAGSGLLIRDPRLSLRAGAIREWPDLTEENPFTQMAEAVARHCGFSLDTPFETLDVKLQQVILQGTGDDWIALPAENPSQSEAGSEAGNGKTSGKRRPRSTEATNLPVVWFQYKGLYPAIDESSRVSPAYRHNLEHLIAEVACPTCKGSRLRPDASALRFCNQTIGQVGDRPLAESLAFFKGLQLTTEQRRVAGELLREIINRLQFLVDVGLEYLTLNRPAPTLSGGESQRIRLASQIGSGLTGVLYVLDEPTIGLHPRDNQRLLQALLHLRNLGNTLVMVEHDREVIAAADYLLDFGPGAGDRGGEITAAGTPKEVGRVKASLTGQYISGKKAIAIPSNRRMQPGETPLHFLKVVGARHNNLKNIDAVIPLGVFVAVTGVSGSGKSSLIYEVLYNTLARKLHRAKTIGAAHEEIVGLDKIDKVISVDQDPIGNSPTSNPATYTGVFDLIRRLFSLLPDAKVRGYQPKRFSFNKPGGRCEACEGNGQKKIEMHFLPDVWVECDVCKGKRYNPESLAVLYKGKSIADVLNMRVAEAIELFANIPKIHAVLQTLADVGLDYLTLGQSAPTLSGGEAQRVKLAAELSRPNTGKTLYLLDEPTTGLHFDDIHKLLEVLNRLVDLGNTVVVVEHNLDVIKTADWILDMGPEAGDAGGTIVAQGTPEEVARVKQSHTGKALVDILAIGPRVQRVKYNPFEVQQADDKSIELEDVGKDSKMPWESDGKRWHTRDRIAHNGKPCAWDGKILEWIDERIRELGTFAPTNWNHRSVIEIAGEKKSQGWFFHGMTGMASTVRLVFRVARNTFNQNELRESLNIRPLNETEGLQVYSECERVKAVQRKGPWQEVVVQAYALSEIDTPEFRAFLKQAVQGFEKNLQKMKTRPEDVMPWKINGEQWHLGEKGFPPGKKMQWDRALLPRVLKLVREIEPGVEVKWDTRDGILLYLPGMTRGWSAIRTKDPTGLGCRFLCRKGQFNLSRIEMFGRQPEIRADREGDDVLELVFLNGDHFHADKLKGVLIEAMEGWRIT